MKTKADVASSLNIVIYFIGLISSKMVIQSAVAVWLTQRETGYSSSVLRINSLGVPDHS